MAVSRVRSGPLAGCSSELLPWYRCTSFSSYNLMKLKAFGVISESISLGLTRSELVPDQLYTSGYYTLLQG